MERIKPYGTLAGGTRLFNRTPDSITNDDADEFINLIQEQRHLGYGFVPLIGAGFSAPSGVPVINEIASYVNRCIVMAMGAMSFEPTKRPWNPRTDQWPPLIDIKNLEEPGGWKAMAKAVLEQRRARNGDESPALQDRYDEALGVMSNWCTALLYLSRLTRESFPIAADGRVELAALDAPQPAIVDACFREALKDKSPTLGHRMLAVLAGALRLDLILTTNFDDLIEHGFAASGNALQVCEVQLGNDLPQWSSVRDVRTLIKLHGNRQGLRADYSLEGYPSQTDKQRLLEYLRLDRDEDDGNVAPGPHRHRNHMLVLGHSVQERRTRAFIEHAWLHLDPSFRVFWVCYSRKDVTSVQSFTARFAARHGNDKRYQEGVWEGSCVLRYSDTGLFLLQLYQRMRRNLPAHTGLFPSVSRLSFPPLESSRARIRSEVQQTSPEVRRFRDDLIRHLRRFRNTDEEFRIVVAASDDGVHGVTTACADTFRALEEADRDLRSTCLWVDMNDMSSADNLFETLLEAAYFRLGQENWTPCYVASDRDRPRTREIERLVSSFNYPCVIFLNARETPGANTPDPEDEKLVHGWLDKQCPAQPSRKRSNDGASFTDLMLALCAPFHLKRGKDRKGRAVGTDSSGAPSRRISVVLMCRQFDESSPLWQHMQDKVPFKLVKLDSGHDGYSDRAVVTGAIEWTQKVPARQRFLHALVLMQRPRPLATIWTAAASLPRKEAIKDDQRVKWLNELEEIGLIRRKAGGFIWIHSRSRKLLRDVLHDEQAMDDLVRGSSEGWSPRKDEPVIHAHLAEWYARVLDSSSAPAAAFEVAYHLCRAADTALKLHRPRSISWAGEKIVAARSFLRTHRFLIQTRGYSRESCRRLEYIRKLSLEMRQVATSERSPEAGFNEKLNLLARTCTEIMRAVAREVGEDSKAYQRQKELALLYIDPSGESLKANERDPVGGAYASGLSKQLHRIRSSPDNPWTMSWLQWLRWWRWLGMLGIASRSFGMAEDSLRRALNYAVTPVLGYEFDREWDQWVRLPHVQPPPGEIGSSRVQELRIEVLRIAEQYVALQLLRQSVSYRMRSLPPGEHGVGADTAQSDEEALKALSRIEGCIVRSLKLGAAIRDNDDSRGSYDTVAAVWCQSRLLMHRSACKVRRLLHGDSSLYLVPQTAMGLLGDAEACLRVADPQRHRSDLALVDLYRAEVQLCRVEALPLEWGHEPHASRPTTLAALCRMLEELPKKTRGELRRELPWLWTPPANLHELQVLVMDALRYFTRAETVLRERRRNVWWTTWFFERKLRAIAASVWLSMFEPRAPIPFLGFEAAASGVDTAADSLLNIGWRMIRVDAYRLATIIDAYGSCAKALHMRLRTDDKAKEEKYLSRQSSMSANLTEALEQLEGVLDARIAAGRAPDETARADDKARMDKHVFEVVKRIQSKNTAIAEAIMPVGGRM